MLLVFWIVCFLASVVGAICGIGGGVIIKPVLDAFHVVDVATISFLSGCTVLSMATYSVIRSKLDGNSHIERATGLPLAMGAAGGGIMGKWIFSYITALSPNRNRVGGIQALCLLIVTLGTLIYTIYKEKITSKNVRNPILCIFIGIFLGVLSSFLGIGGGPINLVILFYFFSMTTKIAAENSLYIIFFSQIASLLSSIVTRSIPNFHPLLLVMMSAGGITGGIVGRLLNKKIVDQTVDKLFIILMMGIIFLNIYNSYIYFS